MTMQGHGLKKKSKKNKIESSPNFAPTDFLITKTFRNKDENSF